MKSVKGATIQLLSPVLGSVAVVAVAVLGLEVLGIVAVKLQVVGIGPGPVGARYTASRTPAVNQRKEGTLCGLHIASPPQVIV